MANKEEAKLAEFLKKLRAGGIMKITTAQNTLFQQATQLQLAETAPDPKPPKKPPKSPTVFGRISPAGRRWLLERESPKEALLALQSTLESRSEMVRSLTEAISVARDTAQRAVKDALEELQSTIESRIELVRTLNESITEAREATHRAVLDVQKSIDTASTTPTPSVASNQPVAKDHTDEIVRYVEEWWRDRGYSCSVAELKQHLDALDTPMSIGTYHDLLRVLHRGGKVSLSNWGRTLSEMPQPELALFLADKVMYYVNPRDRSI